jgi:hypothetical protein
MLPLIAIHRKKLMRGKKLLPLLAACCAVSLACDFSVLAPSPTAAPTAAPTEIAAPTITPSRTETPFPTRTASATLIPGIEEPVKVGDAELLITKALRRDTFRCGEDSTPVENPETDEILIVMMKVVKGPALTAGQLKNWAERNDIDRIELTAETRGGRSSTEPSLYTCYPRDKTSYTLLEIYLGFVIDRNAEIFTLILPDGAAIPLNSIMPT